MEMLGRPLVERDGGWSICMIRRHGLRAGQVLNQNGLETVLVKQLRKWKNSEIRACMLIFRTYF